MIGFIGTTFHFNLPLNCEQSHLIALQERVVSQIVIHKMLTFVIFLIKIFVFKKFSKKFHLTSPQL